MVWNRRTGNVVGGHQRLEQLDALEAGAAYSLDVAVVDLDATKEREVNALLNNPTAMGDWDLDALAAMLRDVDAVAAGFDAVELHALFDGFDDEMAAMLDAPLTPEIAGAVDGLRELAEEAEGPTAEEAADAEGKRWKAERKANREANQELADTEVYLVVVCECREDRERLVTAMGMEPDEKYIDLAGLLSFAPEVRARYEAAARTSAASA